MEKTFLEKPEELFQKDDAARRAMFEGKHLELQFAEHFVDAYYIADKKLLVVANFYYTDEEVFKKYLMAFLDIFAIKEKCDIQLGSTWIAKGELVRLFPSYICYNILDENKKILRKNNETE